VHRLGSDEGGFGLIELMIAMTIMAIGIMAIVAGFSSGIVALTNANRASTAGTLADKQMEAYRGLPYNQIALKASLVTSAPANTAPYTPISSSDTHAGTTDLTDGNLAAADYDSAAAVCSPASPPVTCKPAYSTAGPDGRTYRVDTYIVWYCATGTVGGVPSAPTCGGARATKQITVVVRDGITTSKTYVSETSTFDPAT
jgi:prepilin-type N-terminal cleavage/methylation domain-containing protein